MSLNIVCVTHFFPSRNGGIEVVGFEISRRLAELGHNVKWFASATPVLPENIAGVEYCPVTAIHIVENLLGVPLPIWIWRGVPKLFSAIRTCDAVHIHDYIYPGSLLTLFIARFFGKTVILTQHIGEIPYDSRALRWLLSALNRWIGRFVLKHSSRVVFISNAVASYFHQFVSFQAPPIYAPNGVDSSVYHPVSNDERELIRTRLGFSSHDRVCIFVGRFVEKKGMSILAKLVPLTPQVSWVFAGSGPLHPKTWGAENVMVFEGRQREGLADLYRAADLLVLPSRGEGFPLVVQEAFACGTPALISDETAQGCVEARDTLMALPVVGQDVAVHWQARLAELFSEPSELQRQRPIVAEFARRHWTWERAVAVYGQLYRNPLAEIAGMEDIGRGN